MSDYDKDFDWVPYFGCCAWFNTQDGFLEIVSHTRLVKAGWNEIIWTVIGEKDEYLRISVDMVGVSECPKKYTRIIKPLLGPSASRLTETP